MKTLAKIMIALACLALLALGAYALSSKMEVEARVSVLRAKDAAETLEKARQSGIEVPGDALQGYVVTLSVDMRSYSPFRAEWISLTLKGDDADATVLEGIGWLRDMPAFGKLEGDRAMYITFLSSSDSPVRQAQLEYYIFGRYHMIEISMKD